MNKSDPVQPRTTISQEDWENKLKNITPSKDKLNKIVLNYLIIEGYREGALKFMSEAGMEGKIFVILLQRNIRRNTKSNWMGNSSLNESKSETTF